MASESAGRARAGGARGAGGRRRSGRNRPRRRGGRPADRRGSVAVGPGEGGEQVARLAAQAFDRLACLLLPLLHSELADHLGHVSLAATLVDELLEDRATFEQEADRRVDEDVEQLVHRGLVVVHRAILSDSLSASLWLASQTQSEQSMASGSASWLGCLTRKHDWQTNSPGRRGWIRVPPSVRSSGSGATSSSSSSSSVGCVASRSLRIVSRSASTSSGSSSSSSSSSSLSSSRLGLRRCRDSGLFLLLFLLLDQQVVVVGLEVARLCFEVLRVDVVLVDLRVVEFRLGVEVLIVVVGLELVVEEVVVGHRVLLLPAERGRGPLPAGS